MAAPFVSPEPQVGDGVRARYRPRSARALFGASLGVLVDSSGVAAAVSVL